jgi:hypothetical protein
VVLGRALELGGQQLVASWGLLAAAGTGAGVLWPLLLLLLVTALRSPQQLARR